MNVCLIPSTGSPAVRMFHSRNRTGRKLDIPCKGHLDRASLNVSMCGMGLVRLRLLASRYGQMAGRFFAVFSCALVTMAIAGCQSTTGKIAIDKGACSIWSPLTYSASKDTPETVFGIRQNNAKRQAFCK